MVTDDEIRVPSRVHFPFLVGLVTCAGLALFFLYYTIVLNYIAWIGIPICVLGVVVFGLGVRTEDPSELVEACARDIDRLLRHSPRGAIRFQELLDEVPWNPEILREVLDWLAQEGRLQYSRRTETITSMKKK